MRPPRPIAAAFLICALVLATLHAPSLAQTPGASSADGPVDGRFPTEEAFVDQAYRDFLNRGPDADGLAFWSSRLRSGLTPGSLIEQLLTSPEFDGTVAPVVRLYRSIFDRQPDLDGLQFWVERRQSGATLEQLAEAFIGASEFEEVTASLDTDEIIAEVYERSLGRTPDAQGLAFWRAEVASGRRSLAQFIVAVTESPESIQLRRSDIVTTLAYLGLLQRTPEPGGLRFWSGEIADGLPIVTLADTIIALPEYQERFPTAPTITTEVVASGLTVPWDIESLPDGTLVITERPGGLHVLLPDGTQRELNADFGDLFANGETGVMGLAVDPAFADNRRIYTCQGHSSPREIQVIAWTLNAGLTSATRAADPLVGGLPIVTGRHGGCQLEFDREGNLYIGTGDAATGSHPQNLGSLGGKVLRVDPATGLAAEGNPFAAASNANQRLVFTYGHRNVQGLGLRPGTNEMWSVEHGPNVNDEVNRLTQPGGNAGWNPVPGYNEAVSMTDTRLGANVFGAAYATGSRTLALAGGDWTDHPNWGAWHNAMGVAALKNQTLRLLFFSPDGVYLGQRTILDGEFGRLRAVHQAADGSLYITTSTGTDRVIKVTPTLN